MKHGSNQARGSSRLRLWGLTAVLAAFVAFPLIAKAGDVDVTAVADATAPTGSVSLASGTSENINITVVVSGRVCGTATFDVNTVYTLTGGVFAGSSPVTTTIPNDSRCSSPPPAAETFNIPATVNVAAGHATGGPHTLTVSVFNVTNTATPTLVAGDTATYQVTVIAASNTAPTADAGGPYTGNEGAQISLDGTGSSDSDGTIASYSWTVTPATSGSDQPDSGASCSFVSGFGSTTAQPKVVCTDDGSYDVSLTVTDDDGATDTDTATLTVANVAPVIGTVSPATGTLYAVGTTVNLSAPFTDAGANDSHTCTINWDDGAGAVSGTVTSGSCTGNKTYNSAGVYTIAIVVTDDDGGSDTETVMIIVYDPSAGFVTGGGWINSPAGAYRTDTSLSGKATFGFVSKYQKGATVPTGNTQFQLHFASLNFQSTSYDWLVVAGTSKAQYKGVGTINGVAGYGFLLTAWDGGNSDDKFRIKIWDIGTGDTVYDNNFGASDDIDEANPQVIGGGSIVIHVPKK